MNQEKQPEALRLADWCDANSSGAYRTSSEAAAELRRLHAENIAQRSELVAEAARTAEEKLRSDQMTDQHRMQCNIRADVEAERDRFRAAFNEWHDKTEWVQETSRPEELGMHRADVLRNRIADLEAQLSAIGAGGVESLRKRDGQQPQAWLVYLPSCDAQNVYDSRDDIGYIDDLTNNDDAVVTPLYAALQAELTQAYSIDADPQGIRARVADAITGALAFGAQGCKTPPPEHWLTPFWMAARFEAAQINTLREWMNAQPVAAESTPEHKDEQA